MEHVVLLSQHPNCLSNFSQALKDSYFNGMTMVYSTDSIFGKLPELWNSREELLFEAEPDGNWFTRLDFSLGNLSPVMELMYVNGADGEMLSSDENGIYTLNGLKPGQAYTLSVHAMIMGASYPIELNMRTADFNVEMSDLRPTAVSCQVGYPEGAIVVHAGFEGHDTESGILQWTGLEPETEYTLRYYVTNEKDGTITKDTIFQTPALTFETLPAKATSNTVALICAETNLSDMETGAGFEWRRYDAPELVPSTQSPCPVVDGVLTGALRNLSANTYYKFRPYYTSASGQTYYGDWLAFGTADAYVYFDPTVRTYEATSVTETEARVRGYAIAGSGEITEQGFEYWPEGAPAKRSAADVRRVQAEGQFMTATLAELQPGTTYTFRVYVETAKSTTYGEEQTFTTVDDGTGISGIVGDGETEGLKVAVRGSLSSGNAFIQVSGDGKEAHWTLTGIGGAVAAQGNVRADGTWQTLDAPALPRGLYLLTVGSGETAKTVKLLAR